MTGKVVDGVFHGWVGIGTFDLVDIPSVLDHDSQCLMMVA